MSVVLDAGALVAIERGDRRLIAIIERERRAGRVLVTHAGVVGEVWRGGGGRQAMLARALPSVEIRAIDDDLGRQAGVLLGTAGTSDVLDAAIVLLAHDGDEILTADTADLHRLVISADRHVDLIDV